MEGHLDLLGLDAVRAGDATPEQRAHADACVECRATIAGFRALAARLVPAPMDVPPTLSQEILALGRPKRTWRPVAAAAAVLAIAVAVWFGARPAVPRRPDIVDAYTVAIRLRDGRSVDAKWDLNGDGRVNDQDIEEIARRSVSIR